MLNEKPFLDAVVMAANVEQSLVYKSLSQHHGVVWKQHPLSSKLRYQGHSFGDRVRIHHFNIKRHISQTLKNKTTDDGRRYVELMDEAAVAFFGDKPFLYLCNKDAQWNSKILESCPTAKKLPVSCRGSNKYIKETRLYISAAFNRNPALGEVLTLLGFDKETQIRALAYETYYQAIMRLALRDLNSMAPVEIILPDAIAAEVMAETLAALSVSEIEVEEFRKLKPLTRKQQKQRSRAFKKYREILAAKRGANSNKTFIGNAPQITPNFSLTLRATFHKSTLDHLENQFWEHEFGLQEFIQTMRSIAGDPEDDKKKDVLLFNSTTFKSESGIGYRQQQNFDKAYFLVLDFDDSKITLDDFIKLFGKTAPKADRVPFLIFNSFSRSPLQPNRFRVIVFFHCPAMSLGEYQGAFDYVQYRLEEAGWGNKTQGLDRACRSGNQSFYMPCTNRQYPDWAFFDWHNTETDEIKELGLMPFMFPPDDEEALPEADGSEFASADEIPQELIYSATQMVRGMRSGRHYEFFMAGVRLATIRHNGLRLDRWSVESELKSIAGSERHMRKKVKDIMKSLDRYGHFTR